MNRSLQKRLRLEWSYIDIRRISLHRPAWVATVLLILAMTFPFATGYSQSLPTATRAGDLQIGGGIVFGKSDYQEMKLMGGAFYAAFDFRAHFGLEADFHHAQASEDSTTYARTYEVGPRVHWTYGRLVPYGKVLVGRGVFNYPNNIANLAYNMYTFGGGADFQLTRSINLRGDYEYQNWIGFPLGTLHPTITTVGIAYHFHK